MRMGRDESEGTARTGMTHRNTSKISSMMTSTYVRLATLFIASVPLAAIAEAPKKAEACEVASLLMVASRVAALTASTMTTEGCWDITRG